jgi:hypothetical protein
MADPLRNAARRIGSRPWVQETIQAPIATWHEFVAACGISERVNNIKFIVCVAADVGRNGQVIR